MDKEIEIKFKVALKTFNLASVIAKEEGYSLEEKCKSFIIDMSSDAPAKLRWMRMLKAKMRSTGKKSKYNLEEYGHRCYKCGSYHKICEDHIIPISKGGTDDPDNKQLLCFSCNSSKGVSKRDYRPIAEFKMNCEKYWNNKDS